MTTPGHARIVQLTVPAQPLNRRRSRLGEPTVRIELVVIDSNGQLGKELFLRQAAAVKEAFQRFADHPPIDEPDHQDDTETEATAKFPQARSLPLTRRANQPDRRAA
jgi:hypothetical protein